MLLTNSAKLAQEVPGAIEKLLSWLPTLILMGSFALLILFGVFRGRMSPFSATAFIILGFAVGAVRIRLVDRAAPIAAVAPKMPAPNATGRKISRNVGFIQSIPYPLLRENRRRAR